MLNSGALKINSIPSGAKVYLGGNYGHLGAYIGVTGINIATLKAGRYVIRLNYPGYNVLYQMADVIPGQETMIMANLTQMTLPSYTSGSRIYSLGAPLDAGNYSAPFVVDWNMDGRKDMIVGNGDGQVLYYENTGTDSNPSFGLAPSPILTGGIYAYPFVIDWDNDGKTDIVAGNTYGEAVLFRNISTGTQLAFDSGTVVAKVNDSAVPFVIDWNEDGRKDLVVGSGDGTLNLFLNNGIESQPSFNPTPDYIPLVYGNNMAPFVVTDWDADGKKDLLIGSSNGNLLLYLNSGTNISPVFASSQPVMGTAGPLNVVSNSIPFATDWNNDGLTDILTGNSNGEVYLFTGSPSLITVKIEIEPETLNMNSKGQWVTCKIELPSGYNPEDLIISSLLLQGVIPAETQSVEVEHEEDDDHEADEVKVKFDRQRLQSLLTPGEHVKVFLTGRLSDGRNIKGEDTIKVIDKEEKEKDGR